MTQSSTIPLTFIQDRLRLSWREILVGVEQGWLEQRAAIERAIEHVSIEGSDNEDTIELAGLLKGEESRIVEILQRLADKESPLEESVLRSKWLRIILAWLYETRDQFDDPLQIVEELYADFGYPEEVRDLIRYNEPGDGYRPQDHTEPENLARLMGLWRNYVETYLPVRVSEDDGC